MEGREAEVIYVVSILDKFSRRTDATESIDVEQVIESLGEYGRDSKSIDVHEVIRNLEQGRLSTPSTFVLMSHPNPDIRAFVSDLADVLELQGHLVLPSSLYLRAHENKGLQGLIAVTHQLPFVPQTYAFDDSAVALEDLVVVKTGSGSGSKGVRQFGESRAMRKYLTLESIKRTMLSQVMRLSALFAYRGLFSSIKAMDRFRSERPWTRFVVQRFVSGQISDFKVLVFGSRVYVAERKVRENDFRASGSGKLSFPTPDDALLNMAISVRQLLKVPYVSLDVMLTDYGFQIIEFQTVHFGPSVKDKAHHAYVPNGQKWEEVANTTSLEQDIACALHEFLTDASQSEQEAI